MIKINHLSASYKTLTGDVPAVSDAHFEIYENEIFGIAGESGCGKSTLLKTLYDIIKYPLQVDSGSVIISGTKDGKAFSYKTGEINKSWWDNISYIPQAAMSVLNPTTKLKKQFLDSIPMQDRSRESKEQTLDRVKAYLNRLNLSEDVLDSYPFQLSGGMRQRAIIALATFMSPDIVLADEPTTALDVVVQKGILMMLMNLQKRLKNTMVIVSHDLGVHYQITDRIGIMYSGRMMEIGKTEDVFENPLHPYTSMLIDALPRVGDQSDREGIPGAPPSMRVAMPGCRFAPRCPKATDACSQSVPEFREVAPGHFAACHLLNPQKESGGNE
ncbi:MAG: ABC transporter ATP-binding protein [Christensenellales bacterium]|jgi:peptide/nickel transport system ATP-binding protein